MKFLALIAKQILAIFLGGGNGQVAPTWEFIPLGQRRPRIGPDSGLTNYPQTGR